jgi:hypothetical protein
MEVKLGKATTFQNNVRHVGKVIPRKNYQYLGLNGSYYYINNNIISNPC